MAELERPRATAASAAPVPVAAADPVGFLDPEVQAGRVVVTDTGASLKVRLVGSALFKSGSTDLSDEFAAIVTRIGVALKDRPGPITVAGYSDNIPLSRRGRFKDNAALSLARAQQAAKLLAAELGGFDRLTAEGRGEKDPVADNATPDGRAENRRIEILLVKQEAG